MPNDDYILPAKVKNYDEFKEKIIAKIGGEVNKEILVNKNIFCHPSKDVSKKILDTLRILEDDKDIKSNYEKFTKQ